MENKEFNENLYSVKNDANINLIDRRLIDKYKCQKHGNLKDNQRICIYYTDENGEHKTKTFCILCLMDLISVLEKDYNMPKVEEMTQI